MRQCSQSSDTHGFAVCPCCMQISINQLQILMTATHYVCKAHLFTESVSSTPTSPSPWARPKSCDRTSGTLFVDLHKAGMRNKTITEKLGEKVTTIGAIIWKWKKFKITFIQPWSWASYKIFIGSRWSWQKVVDQSKITQKETVNHLETAGTTVDKKSWVGRTSKISVYVVWMA